MDKERGMEGEAMMKGCFAWHYILLEYYYRI